MGRHQKQTSIHTHHDEERVCVLHVGFPTHQQAFRCKNLTDPCKTQIIIVLPRNEQASIPSVSQVRRYVSDIARIYSITITNALDGSASSCHACAMVSQESGSSCVPCPAGHFIDKDTNQCQECPPNTFLSGHHIYGQEACQPCGPGSKSNKVGVFM